MILKLIGFLTLYTHLYSALRKANPHRDLLPEEYVGIVGLAETPLQFVELCRREPRPMALLFCRFVVALANHRASTLTGETYFIINQYCCK